MPSDEEEIKWVSIPNSVEKRTLDSSLIYTLVPSRRLRRRTKLVNATIKKLHRVKSYSQYVQVKTAVLRCIPEDTDTDDSDDYTDDDFGKIYKSDESMRKFLLENSRNSEFLTYTDSDADDYVNLATPAQPSTSDNNLGWKTVIRRNRARSIPKQRTINQTTNKRKRTARLKTVAPRKTNKGKNTEETFTPSCVKHSNEDPNEENDASSNGTNVVVPETTVNVTEAVTENENTSEPETHLEINDDSGGKVRLELDNVKQEEEVYAGNANEETIKDANYMEELSMKNNFRDDDESNDTICDNGIKRELETDVHLGDNITKLVRDDSLENIFNDNKNHSGESVKKNLTDDFNSCSVISRNKDSENKDNILDESTDINRTHFRFSEINSQCRSTPIRAEKKQLEIGESKQIPSHPKDSGIDEDSQEEYLCSVVNAAPNDRASPSLNNNNDSSNEFEEQSTIIAKQDAKEENQPRNSSEEDSKTLRRRQNITSDSHSELDKTNQVQKQKAQPTVKCTSIINQKVTIINLMPKAEVENSKEHVETKQVPDQRKPGDLHSDKIISSPKQESNTDEPFDSKDDELSEEYSENENLADEISASAKKRLNQFKRLNLLQQCSSSENENANKEQTLQRKKTSKEMCDFKIDNDIVKSTVAGTKVFANEKNLQSDSSNLSNTPKEDCSDEENSENVNGHETTDVKESDHSSRASTPDSSSAPPIKKSHVKSMQESQKKSKRRLSESLLDQNLKRNNRRHIDTATHNSVANEDNLHSDKTISSPKQETNRKEPVSTKDDELLEQDSENENFVDEISASAKKRLNQFKRLNLLQQCSSSEDENANKEQTLQRKKTSKEMCDFKIDNDIVKSTVAGTKVLANEKNLQSDSSNPSNTPKEDCSDEENSENVNGHETTDVKESGHSSRASTPDSISAPPTKKSRMKSMQESPKKSKRRLSESSLDQKLKRNNQRHIDTATHNFEKNEDNLHSDKTISSPKQDTDTNEPVNTKDNEVLEDDSENENLVDEISVSTKRRLNQLKRLNLFQDCSSSEDEDVNPKKKFKQKKKSRKIYDAGIDTVQPHTAEPTVTSVKELKNQKSAQSESSKPSNTPKEDCSDQENSENENGHGQTDVKESNHSSRASTPDSISAPRTKKNRMKSMQESLNRSGERLSPSLLDGNLKKNNQKDVGTATHNFVVNGETQTDMDIPVETRVTHERPRKLQQYVEEENLITDFTPPAFSYKDISDEEEVYLIDIPASVLDTELIGTKFVLKEKRIKFGNQKYKTIYKDSETVTCVLGSGKIRKPFKIVEIKPEATVVCHTRIQQEQSCFQSEESDFMLQLSDSAEPRTPNEKTKLERKLKSNSNIKLEDPHHHETSPKVSYQKRKKRKIVPVIDNGESTN